MSEMVAVIGEDGLQAGEMFPRRAHQLVKKQRAAWLDKRQQSIKLLPGVELDEDEGYDEEESSERIAESRKRKRLYEIARRHIRERRNFIVCILGLKPSPLGETFRSTS